ncbi:hypothetical protein [Tepidibacter formicigenes]|jgi:hypothetical protein|uniref:Twitching motility protein PilT n=1 Tax=Tepidibacter formicigenes DSM 15518 TaxID=1123349 RepID=A0A1M6JXQ0_9FIRM|nr:hypothetical protein [Tepidibacter formicigenes]SHJ51408.1 hypothetical protein SAMN02744037_00206 [Tepidibacter formicigenes DSM 15518]
MIQLLLNKAGSGKTKKMIEMANSDILSTKGQLVFIDSSNKHMYDLHRNIRLISTKDFNLSSYRSFYGFICGIISENYDIEKIYIDGIGRIISNISDNINEFLYKIEGICNKYSVKLIISLSTEDEKLISSIQKHSFIQTPLALA